MPSTTVSCNLPFVRTNEDLVLDALGDASRRDLLQRLAVEPASVQQLADSVSISRPAVSQHLKVLREAGLVSSEPAGTRRIYTVAPEGIRMLRAYLDTLWRTAFADFGALAEQEQTKEIP